MMRMWMLRDETSGAHVLMAVTDADLCLDFEAFAQRFLRPAWAQLRRAPRTPRKGEETDVQRREREQQELIEEALRMNGC